jgi:HD-GYP domain-containing protein (c-di-GMP phosphodiesterase class II)
LAIDAASLWEEQQRINEELKIAYDSTLKGWSFALELHDYETFGHSDRVTDRTVRLAQKMGVRQDQLIHIRRGSILHDIGKMGVPESILNKKEKLSESDWKIIREHPLYARRLLEPIDFLKEAVDIPYYHHEWWNGGGYPEGLMKEQIPLAARIFAVIDVWDALSYPRPYRDAWPKEKVYQYIKDLSGIQFDPQVVSAFLEMLTEEEQERID